MSGPAAAAGAAALLVILACASAKTTIEPCAGADTCAALLGYTLYADMKVSEVAALFGSDPAALLAANALDFASPGAANRILPAGLALRVPTRCACSDGVRRSVSVRYAARPADTLASVADVVFSGLASADQIRNANGLAEEDPDAQLDPGQMLVIPFPCVCFNSTDNNLPAVYLSYVARVGDTVESIAASHATTVTDLSNVNAMGSPVVAPGDILAIPLPACESTFPNSASDYGLLVANGTYALTAGNCVECSCGPGDLNLYCTPASLTATCSSMQCPNSNLMLGNVTAQSSSSGCSVSSCNYAGLVNGSIATSLSSGLQPTCPEIHWDWECDIDGSSFHIQIFLSENLVKWQFLLLLFCLLESLPTCLERWISAVSCTAFSRAVMRLSRVACMPPAATSSPGRCVASGNLSRNGSVQHIAAAVLPCLAICSVVHLCIHEEP